MASRATTSPRMSERRQAVRPDIQRLRGVSVLLVVLFHIGVLPGGFIGVDAFFVISGYVVAASVLREVRRTSRFDLRRFLVRRARRLLPALGLMTTTVLILSILLLGFSVQPLAAATAIGAHLIAANAVLYVGGGGYFSPSDERNPFLHTWSLSVEEQFFLLLGVLLLLLILARNHFGKTRLGMRIITLTGSAVALTSFALSLFMSYGIIEPNKFIGLPERFAFYSPATRLWEFMVGVILASVPHQSIGSRWRRALGLTAPLLLLGTALLLDANAPFPGLSATAPVGATAIGIWAGMPGRSRGIKSRPEAGQSVPEPLGWLGDNSYSWYLWHWPLLVFARELLGENPTGEWAAVLVALFIAHISRSRIEDPIRFDQSPTVAKILVVSTVPPLAAGVILLVGGTSAWGVSHPAEEGRGIAYRNGCHDADRADWTVERCRFGDGGDGLVLLLGDSHAATLTEGVIAAAATVGMDSAIWTRSACPFLPGHTPHEGRVQPRTDSDCGAWQDDALRLIDEMQPDIVVLGQRSSGLANLLDPVGALNERFLPGRDALAPTTEAEAADHYRLALADALAVIHERGASVVVVHNVPEFSRSQFDPFDRSFVKSPDPPTIDRAAASARSAAGREVEATLTESLSWAATVDPFPMFCDATSCFSAADPGWLYFDRHHLSAIGSLTLAPSLRDAFLEVRGVRATDLP